MIPPEPIPPPAGWQMAGQARIPVVPPYRLDLTATVLRRIALNPVDVLAADGRYMRAFAGPGGAWVVAATQAAGADALDVAVYGPARQPPHPAAVADLAATLRRTLGTQIDLAGFYAAARAVPRLYPLVVQAEGVKPPRYPTLWEAICNTVVFQQVSIDAAMASMRRFITHYSVPVAFGETVLYLFPTPEATLGADPAALRAQGLSGAKVRTLQNLANELLAGTLTAAELDALPTPAAMARLTGLRGIGPWTAAVIMLRGFGRLDAFPAGDSGARRSMAGLLGVAEGERGVDGAAILAALGPWRGMLYYHLLLWRLQQRGLLTPAPGGP
jgi:DNA-3-methyladenine glycosylase II